MKKALLFFSIWMGLITTVDAQKNVLFIAVDDLKPLMGAYGFSEVLTPNIDKLAAKGTLFKNAECQQAVCGPSRASLLTGLYPDATEVFDLNTLIRDKKPNVVTLPQYFKSQGYTTVGAGKIFDSRSVDSQYDGVSWSQEFKQSMPSSYYNSNTGTGYSGYQNPSVQVDALAYNQYLVDNNITSTTDKNTAKKLFPFAKPSTENYDVPDDGYKDGARVTYAIEKMNGLANSSDPFFLAVGFSKPHLPFVAPKKYWDLYDRANIEIHPEQGRDPNIPSLAFHSYGELINNYSDIPMNGVISVDKQKELIHGYRACVSYIDAQIGDLLNRLDELGLADDTIVILWGDHGWHLGDHGLWAKHSNFEQAVRSPLIIYSPNQGLGNNVTESPVEFVDIFPTLCDLSGIDIPANLHGRSLKSIMADPNASIRDAALSQYPRNKGGERHMGYTLRNTRYRYTKWIKMNYYEGERYGSTEGRELYDYDLDPHETTNLASDPAHAAVVEEFEFLFKERNIAQNSPSSFLDLIECADSYKAPDDQTYSTDGVYTAIIPAKNGLDSVITIRLNLIGHISNGVTKNEDKLIADQDGAEYIWFDCSNSMSVPNATDKEFFPSTAGEYKVRISIPGCQTVTSSCIAYVPNQVLDLDGGTDVLRVFPNPTKNGNVTIQFEKVVNEAKLELLDLSGRTVLVKMVRNKISTRINSSSLSGMYILRIQSKAGIIHQRVFFD